MMSYTPGPWGLWPNRENSSPIVCVGSDAMDLRGICTVSGYGPETAANARLIAASPEMYEALSRLVDAVRAIKSSEFDRASDWVKLDDVLIECERVMGKAVMK